MMNEQVDIAIIGGTGVYDPGLLTDTKRVKVYTPYGAPSDLITIGNYNGIKLAFIPRHGTDHHLPPHMVPYRANLWALKELGVTRILAPCAVGSLRPEIKPGHIVIADQFLDFTKTREYSFYDGGQIAHIAVHESFCRELRDLAIATAKQFHIEVHDKANCITIEGPRFSTRAESEFFRDAAKGDIIGMTLVPECILARELKMCYVSIASVTDYDTWADEPVDAMAVIKIMKENIKTIRKLISEMLPKTPRERGQECVCSFALQDAVF